MSIEFEERCQCGYLIPAGYGYYNLNKAVRCFYCGRTNQRYPIPERAWLTKAIVDRIKKRKLNKKKKEIEELKLEIEKAKLNKELKDVKKEIK